MKQLTNFLDVKNLKEGSLLHIEWPNGDLSVIGKLSSIITYQQEVELYLGDTEHCLVLYEDNFDEREFIVSYEPPPTPTEPGTLIRVLEVTEGAPDPEKYVNGLFSLQQNKEKTAETFPHVWVSLDGTLRLSPPSIIDHETIITP